jgi:hypothetical protein
MRSPRSKNRPAEITFREKAVGQLTPEIGVYVLYDLNDVAVYVGQTVAKKERGIRGRVQRHLTSARSDIVANRMIDVWEIAWVRVWPEPNLQRINEIEAGLFHRLNPQSTLMNGSVFKDPGKVVIPNPYQTLQVLRDEDIKQRLNPSIRLPRQIEHYGQMISHYLNVKDSSEIARSMDAHFTRLTRYHRDLLKSAGPVLVGHGADED